MKLRYFGTDGIRGLYGSEVLNDAIAYRAGKAAVRVARETFCSVEPRIVVGRDTRASGIALLRAFASGVASEGGTVVDLGIAPTPCVAFAARQSDAVLGCALTASHNPASDNGIKFFDDSGVKPSEELEGAIDAMVSAVSAEAFVASVTVATEDGSTLRSEYARGILAAFPSGILAGKRLALDCANGAMSEIAPAVFRELGASVEVVGNDSDGTNINAGVGSECPESLGVLYSRRNYDLGIAFDGDGDRLVLFDEKGAVVEGEAVLAMLAIDAKVRGKLPGDTLVTTVQSNLGLDSALETYGIKTVRTDVGDKHIVRLMLKAGYALGGEESGHVVVGSFALTGDGLVAAVSLAGVVERAGKPLSELASVYAAFPQLSRALRVTAKPALEECPNLSKCVELLALELGDAGRLLVRYSGTEAKIRLLVEARERSVVVDAMARLEAAVGRDLEVV